MSAHDVFTDALQNMSGDDRDRLYDEADEMDLARWHLIDLEAEREELTEKALDECLKAGVSTESLKTLARETGCVRWALQHSLKG